VLSALHVGAEWLRRRLTAARSDNLTPPKGFEALEWTLEEWRQAIVDVLTTLITLTTDPVSLATAVLAVALAISAARTPAGRERIPRIGLAIISGLTAWMIVSGWGSPR
jgi:hypothetical protein